MNESGLRTFMAAKAHHEWDENIAKGKVPELTRENLTATFQTIHASRGALFERGVLEIYLRCAVPLRYQRIGSNACPPRNRRREPTHPQRLGDSP